MKKLMLMIIANLFFTISLNGSLSPASQAYFDGLNQKIKKEDDDSQKLQIEQMNLASNCVGAEKLNLVKVKRIAHSLGALRAADMQLLAHERSVKNDAQVTSDSSDDEELFGDIIAFKASLKPLPPSNPNKPHHTSNVSRAKQEPVLAPKHSNLVPVTKVYVQMPAASQPRLNDFLAHSSAAAGLSFTNPTLGTSPVL